MTDKKISYYAYHRAITGRLVEIKVTRLADGYKRKSTTGRTFRNDREAQAAMIERNCQA